LRAYATRRLRGFEQALAEHDLKCVSFLLDFPQGGARPWLQTVSRWLREQVRPLGVFTDNDECGQAILTACRMAELRVPEEIAVLGVDDDDLFCETQKPGLSSIESPNEHVGLVAARRVCEMIRAGVTSAPSVLVGPGEVVVRRSTDTLVVEDDAVRQALEFMRSQFHRRIAVDDILRHVPISRRNLERRFRTALGQSILEELTRLRLAAAMRALARTDLSVADVAAQSGFSNSTHLGVVMRQRLGVSPRTYRRRARNPVAPALTQAPAVAQNVE
jgi:LacI family transcriptional regulator